MTITPDFDPGDAAVIFSDEGKYIDTFIEAILFDPIEEEIDPDTFIRYRLTTNGLNEQRLVREQGVTFADQAAAAAYVGAQP